MPDSNFQNFEIHQEQEVVPASTVGTRNKLLYALIPIAVFLVIFAVVASMLAGKRPVRPVTITATPTPQATVPASTGPLSISTSSAFFQYVASISAVNKSLDTVDLQESALSVPILNMHVSFDKQNQ